MSDLYKFGYTLYETIKTMRDVIDTGNYDRMFLDTYYWLKMLSEYKEIGTVEECRKAVEKQKAKKPLGGVDIAGNEYVICPHCSAIEEDGEWRADYCPDCGQAIRRDENLEETENEQIKFGVLL